MMVWIGLGGAVGWSAHYAPSRSLASNAEARSLIDTLDRWTVFEREFRSRQMRTFASTADAAISDLQAKQPSPKAVIAALAGESAPEASPPAPEPKLVPKLVIEELPPSPKAESRPLVIEPISEPPVEDAALETSAHARRGAPKGALVIEPL